MSAVLTFVIWSHSEKAERRYQEFQRLDGRETAKLLLLARLRTISSVLLLLLSLGYALLAMAPAVLGPIDLHTLPHWLSFLDLIYGPYLGR